MTKEYKINTREGNLTKKQKWREYKRILKYLQNNKKGTVKDLIKNIGEEKFDTYCRLGYFRLGISFEHGETYSLSKHTIAFYRVEDNPTVWEAIRSIFYYLLVH